MLLAEDHAETARLVTSTLRGPYEVEVVDNGARALASARRSPPDLVLTDLNMPVLTGRELLSAMRDDPVLRDVPVVVVTASDDVDVRVELLTSGAADLLVKPFAPRELLARVGNVVGASRARRQAREAEARLARMLDGAPIATALVDGLDLHVLRVNQAWCSMLGLVPADVEGRPLDVLSGDELTALRERLVDGAMQRVDLETTVRHALGHRLPAIVSVSRLSDGDDVQLVVQAQDVTQRRRIEDELRHHADHDYLTGLFNRRAFVRRLEEEAATIRRYGGEAAVVVLDLDGFKAVNDSGGHERGDEVLVAAARSLGSRLRETDVAARLGGDEFAVLLPHTDAEQAARVSEDLAAGIAALASAPVTASIGVAVLAPGACDVDAVLREADHQMYRRKTRGR